MFFYLSKIGFFFLRPSNALLMLLIVGAVLLLTRFQALARRIIIAAAIGLVAAGLSPLPNLLMMPLENRFPIFEGEGPVTGIILLGGAFETSVGMTRNVSELNEAGDRIVAFADLARRFPKARLIVSGGSGNVLLPDIHEAPVIATLVAKLGIERDRIELESQSKNTFQNALYSKQVAKPITGERWLMITSAFHMPRAMGCFRAVEFDVVPVPVDYRTAPGREWLLFASVSAGLARLDVAVREWVGLLVYWATGRVPSLLPGPAARHLR